jgi:hypothetical protein
MGKGRSRGHWAFTMYAFKSHHLLNVCCAGVALDARKTSVLGTFTGMWLALAGDQILPKTVVERQIW